MFISQYVDYLWGGGSGFVQYKYSDAEETFSTRQNFHEVLSVKTPATPPIHPQKSIKSQPLSLKRTLQSQGNLNWDGKKLRWEAWVYLGIEKLLQTPVAASNAHA